LDLISGSNCCEPETLHLFLRKANGTFAARQEIKFAWPDPVPFAFHRANNRPWLLDWDRDGRTDLVIPASFRAFVSSGPLARKTELAVRSIDLPIVDGDNPLAFSFADWDGDGVFDLLVGGQFREVKDGPWRYRVSWYRNTSTKGEPAFAKARVLLTIPAEWELNAFAVVDHNRDGRADLVVSATKDWTRKKDVGWTCTSQLLLYHGRG